MGFPSEHLHPQSRGLGVVTDFKLFIMEVEYIVPRIIEAQKPKQEQHGTNPDRQQRYVYLRRSPLKKSWAGRKGRFLAKLARYPPLAHWLIEVRSTKSEPGPIWEIKPVKETGWRLEYRTGRWEDPSPRHIKVSEKKLGTTTLTDKEIDDLATEVVSNLQTSKDTFQVRAINLELKMISKCFPKESMMGEQFSKDRSSADYNAWFKNCHQFSINMAHELCGQSFLGKWKLNFYFQLMPSAIDLLGLQQYRL